MNTKQNIIGKVIALCAACLSSLGATAQGYHNPFHPQQPQVIIVQEQPVDYQPTDEWSYKLYTGLNLSELLFKKEKGIVDPDSKLRPGFDIGLRLDHYIYNNFSYYRSMGFRYSYGLYRVNFEDPEGNTRVTQNRFIFPFTIGVLGRVGNSFIGVGPNLHLGAAFGGTTRNEVNGVKDTYSSAGDESSFVFGIGAEAWFTHNNLFFSFSYNRSMEWYDMPEEFGDFKSNGRNLFSLNIGYCF